MLLNTFIGPQQKLMDQLNIILQLTVSSELISKFMPEILSVKGALQKYNKINLQ